MDLKPVKSGNIKAIGYDPQTKTMRVQFHTGKVYAYPETSEKEHADLMKAESIGTHFAAHFRKPGKKFHLVED